MTSHTNQVKNSFDHCHRTINRHKKEGIFFLIIIIIIIKSMSGDTESSKPNSGGCGGGTTNNPVKDEAIDASPFQEGEQVLAFHGPCLYDAKVSLSIVLLYWETQLSITSVLFRYEWCTVFTGELETKCGVILWGKWNEMNLKFLILFDSWFCWCFCTQFLLL